MSRKPLLPVPLALALAYGTFYLGVGIQMPYLPLWLEHRGLSAAEIGFVMSAPLLTRLVSTPLAGMLSDRLGRPKALLAGLGLATAAGFAGLAALDPGVVAYAVAVGLISMVWFPGFSLLDAYAGRQARAGRVDYGRARQWGSLAFLAANLAGGAVVGAAGAGSVVFLLLGCQMLFLAATVPLPELSQAPPPPPDAPGLIPRPLWLAAGIAAAALVQASHAALYVFSTVYWASLGYSLTVIGLLWATGVASEIVLFRKGTALVARLGPHRMIALGGLAAVVRFTALALEPPLWLLFGLQTLHAFTFGATYLGMVQLISRHVGEHRAGTGQAAAAWTVNLVAGAATFAAGPLWSTFAAGSFLVSAALGLAGALLAGGAARLGREPSGPGSGG